MATNLEYIYRLKDQYTKKLQVITKAQVAFTQQYTKSMGKVNATLIKNTTLLNNNTKAIQANAKYMQTAVTEKVQANQRHWSSVNSVTNAYNRNKQSITALKNEMGKLNSKQKLYNASSNRGMRAPVGRGLSGSRGVSSDKLGALTAGTGGGFFLASAIRTTAEFERNLNRIESVLPKVNRQVLSDAAIDMGNRTIFSAIDVSAAMAEAAQAGMKQNEILKRMPANLGLAAAGQLELYEAVQLSTDVVNQFGRTVKNVDVANMLARGARSTSNIREVGAALSNVGTLSHNAGIKIKDMMHALMIMGETSERGDPAGTYAMNFLLAIKRMKKGTDLYKGMRKFLSGTGYKISDMFDVKTGNIKNIQTLLRLMRNVDAGKLNALQKTFRIQGGKFITAVSAVSNKRASEFLQILNDTNITAEKQAAIMQKGLPGALARLGSAWDTTKIKMGLSFPILEKIIDRLAEGLVYLQKNHKWVLQTGFVIIGLTTVLTGLGFAIWAVTGALGAWGVALGAVGGLIKFLFYTPLMVVAGLTHAWTAAVWLLSAAFWANPITWIVAGIASLVAILTLAYMKTNSVTDAFKILGGMIIKSLLTPVTLAMEAIRGLFYLLSKIPGSGGKAFGGLYDSTTKQIEAFQMLMTGNKSHSVFGMGGDLLNKQGSDISSWTPQSQVEQESKKATSSRYRQNDNNFNVGGMIKVAAEKGSEVIQSSFAYELGDNMGYYD